MKREIKGGKNSQTEQSHASSTSSTIPRIFGNLISSPEFQPMRHFGTKWQIRFRSQEIEVDSAITIIDHLQILSDPGRLTGSAVRPSEFFN